MCGIAGIISQYPVPEEDFLSAVDCLAHRGPQHKGFWHNEDHTVYLGHRRLSIIDLSDEALQPMGFLNRYQIIHNGELYNYLEIKEQLRQKGYVFTTASDTEVIVASYDAWGVECLQYFDGMFSFAIWDAGERCLFAARDRFGEKPFYYSLGDQLLFASEMKSIWKAGLPKEVNKAMLYNFLTIGYTCNPANPDETFYENIKKLPAASFLKYDPRNKELVIQKYWQMFPGENKAISLPAAIDQFTHLLKVSVSRRLRSDVSIGTSLSGGLDSSTIVSFIQNETSRNYSHNCFTATFGGFEKDERAYAQTIARLYHLNHYLVTIDEKELPALMDKVMWHQEEPVPSASALAQYKVFEAARQQETTVLLDGQGADEILAGYSKYYHWYWQELYRQRQLHRSGELSSARALGITEPFGIKQRVAALLPEFSAALLQSQKARKASRHPLLDPDFVGASRHLFYYSTPTSFDLNGVLYYNTFINGLEELLRMADRNSMAHAVEVRLPFLYHELVSFLFTLPPELKIHKGWTKWLLRNTMKQQLPKEIVWRKDKTGFEPPQKRWMQNKDIQKAIIDAKEKLASYGILANSPALKKVEPHSAYAANSFDWKCWTASYLFRPF